MPKTRSPRKGSLQYWPRKRAKRIYSRVRAWPDCSEVKLLGFAGYKVGMTHLTIIDTSVNSPTKGENISIPATIVECPPLKTLSLRFYKKTPYGLKISTSILASNLDKELARIIVLPKKTGKKIEEIKPEEYDNITLQVYTQPRLIKLKKKPEIFELVCGGKDTKEKFEFFKGLLGKEIKISDVFKPGEQVDIHSVTKGKGTQGPVKRFGVSIRSHKSEKTKRGPGNLGAWTGNRSWTVAHAGQMGFHTRTELNKWVIMVGNDPKLVNPVSGFNGYGLVKGDFMLLKGSVGGVRKRLIRMNHALRPNSRLPKEVQVEVINK